MQSYLISVLCIVIISVLIEIILPTGQTAKYIKGIFSIFVVYVLINPVVLFLNKDFDISKYINEANINLDETLLKKMYDNQIETRQIDIENQLSSDGFEGVKVRLNYKIVDSEIIITKAIVNLNNLVITENAPNINKYQYIRQVVITQYPLKAEEVIFE